ncbi:MAG TPA: hypothetical protein VK935_05245 [Actinomycetospora sp.]|nr:hypothetical protein [Actinomycetospora sp.]
MTLSPELAAPLLTDADVHERVDVLIGPAVQDRCLWLVLVDGDRKQAPVVMPVEDSPPQPDAEMVDGLQTVLAGFVEELATDAGPGSCVFVWERLGARLRDGDELWSEALAGAARGAGLACLGVFVSTPVGIRRSR